jgi:hypothetical protein
MLQFFPHKSKAHDTSTLLFSGKQSKEKGKKVVSIGNCFKVSYTWWLLEAVKLFQPPHNMFVSQLQDD